MSVQLLDKTRKINKLLHNSSTQKVLFNDICKVLSEVTESNVLVISYKGKVLGVSNKSNIDVIDSMIENEVSKYIDDMLNERFLSVLSTKENVNLITLGFDEYFSKKYKAIVAPVNMAGERLGTLFIYRDTEQYEINDIILCEYGTTVVGLEMLRSVSEENDNESRNIKNAKAAVKTLSYTEIEALKCVFSKIEEEGTLVTSRIADEIGITRSVIVNAIKKFASAGILESKSNGMKGTYIKIINKFAIEELNKF